MQLTRYAEENQLAYIKESRSSAIFDCVVVIPDMFAAVLSGISELILLEHSTTPPLRIVSIPLRGLTL
jgi:hypothetical protein